MSFKDHPEYNLEMNCLDNTMIYLEEVILLIEEKRTTFKADLQKLLVVQGVAGSGKTTIQSIVVKVPLILALEVK